MVFDFLYFCFGKQVGDIFPNAVITVGTMLHFGFCLFNLPALVKDAVHSGNQPRPVGTVVAMDEDCAVLLLFFNQVQDFGDVFRFDIPRQQWAVDDVDAVLLEIVVVIAVEKAQIDDAFDTLLRNGFAVLGNRLFAAVEFVIDTVKVGILLDRYCPKSGIHGSCFLSGRGLAGGKQEG